MYLDKFIILFIDDILVYSKSQDEHIKHLHKVFQVLREKQLYANIKKYDFWYDMIIFIRHVIS